MRILDYLNKDLIFLDINAIDKYDAIAKVTKLMAKNNALSDVSSFFKEVKEREALGSTGIGNGVALPHARTERVDNIVIAFARLSEPINFKSEDNKPVQLLFLLGTPPHAVGEYLKVLAKLSKLLKQNNIRNDLMKAETANQVLLIFDNTEE